MISVIIPTYNEEKNIERCLKSLENQTVPRNEFEVIVVDGQSKDRTVEIAKKYADKIIQQKSKGVGGARNDGARVAKGDIIATTDADCILFKNWIKRIQKNLKRKNVIGMYGILKPIDIPDTRLKKIKYKVVFMIGNEFMKFTSKLDYHNICGGNCAFDHEIFEKVGGYRSLPILDDLEIGTRIKRLGKIILDVKMLIGFSVRRLEKIGLQKYSVLQIKNRIKLFLKKRIKEKYTRQEYSKVS